MGLVTRTFAYFEQIIDPFTAIWKARPVRTPRSLILMHLRDHKGVFTFLGVVTAGTAVTEALMAKAIGDLVALAEDRTASINAVLWPVIAILVLRFAFGIAQDLIVHQTLSTSFTDYLRRRSFVNVLNKEALFFALNGSGRVASQIMQSSMAIRNLLIDLFRSIFFILMFFATSLYVFSGLGWSLSAVVLGWFILTVFALYRYLPQLRAYATAASGARSTLTGRMTDIFANINLIKLFSNKSGEQSFVDEAFRQNLAAFQQHMRSITELSNIVLALNIVMIGLILGLALTMWNLQTASIGAVATAGALALRLYALSNGTMWRLNTIYDYLGSISSGMEVHDSRSYLEQPDDLPPLERVLGQIEFDKVSFSYDGEKQVLNNVSLDIRPGMRIAITGPSGAGKSTLTNLLLKLYPVGSGTIRIDRRDISKLSAASIRSQISVVSQDHSMLDRSIRENLTLGQDARSDEEIWVALRRAHAEGFVRDARDSVGRTGLDSRLGEKGSLLSGGQKQRLSIARALLKDAPILILDEPTSALDSLTEEALQRELDEHIAGRTVLAIAHRLSTIADFDLILVMMEGRLVESGKHAELIGQDGLYARLWRQQTFADRKENTR